MSHSLTMANDTLTIQPYGRLEIKKSLQENLLRALIVSAAIHITIIGAYYSHQYFGNEDDAPVVSVRLMKYSELGPPPSIMNTEQIPPIGVSVATAKPTIGIPVPVPDVEVNPEQTIATQQELSQVQSPVVSEGLGKGGIVVEQDIKIEEEEPELDAFIPVEQPPVSVKQVMPEYPDLARRAGIEGVVWVKILVTKEGKAKKAVVIKSGVDLFNEPAVQAALQWVFAPAMMNSGPVSVWVAVPFRFQLNKRTL